MKPPTIKKIGKYTVYEEIGSGGFSTVYACVHEDTGRACAVKIGNHSVWREYQNKQQRVEEMTHMEEWGAYKLLKYGRGPAHKAGIPSVYETGLVRLSDKEIYPYLIMQLLGRHVGREVLKPTFTKERFYNIAGKMLICVRYMHEVGLIHRDIKPSNFCLGNTSSEEVTVYILDMGFAIKKAVAGDDESCDFVGTPDYSSTTALLGIRQGPRDDIESLGYGFLEMWLGDLPWYLTSNDSAAGGWTADSLKKMAEKRDQKFDQLAQVGDIPKFLVKWITYSKNLKAIDMPSYDYLHSLISKPEANPEAKPEAKPDSGKKRKVSEDPVVEPIHANPCKKLRELEPEE